MYCALAAPYPLLLLTISANGLRLGLAGILYTIGLITNSLIQYDAANTNVRMISKIIPTPTLNFTNSDISMPNHDAVVPLYDSIYSLASLTSEFPTIIVNKINTKLARHNPVATVEITGVAFPNASRINNTIIATKTKSNNAPKKLYFIKLYVFDSKLLLA